MASRPNCSSMGQSLKAQEAAAIQRVCRSTLDGIAHDRDRGRQSAFRRFNEWALLVVGTSVVHGEDGEIFSVASVGHPAFSGANPPLTSDFLGSGDIWGPGFVVCFSIINRARHVDRLTGPQLLSQSQCESVLVLGEPAPCVLDRWDGAE